LTWTTNFVTLIKAQKGFSGSDVKAVRLRLEKEQKASTGSGQLN